MEEEIGTCCDGLGAEMGLCAIWLGEFVGGQREDEEDIVEVSRLVQNSYS